MIAEPVISARYFRKLSRVSRNMRRPGASYRRRLMWWRLSGTTFDKLALSLKLVARKDLI